MALNQKKKNISFVPVNSTSLGQKYCFTTATTASLMEIYTFYINIFYQLGCTFS